MVQAKAELEKINKTGKEHRTRGIKGVITGPNTVLWEIPSFGLGNYTSIDKLQIDIAQALSKVSEAMLVAGADIIQVDEQYFALAPDRIKVGKSGLEMLIRSIRRCEHAPKMVIMHVCGRMRQIVFDQLGSIDGIDMLDCGFAYEQYRQSFQVITKSSLVSRGWNVGLGVIDITTDNVESVDDIKKLIRRALKLYGAERLMIDPDCGLRNLKEPSARRKLQAMVQATLEVKQEEGLD